MIDSDIEDVDKFFVVPFKVGRTNGTALIIVALVKGETLNHTRWAVQNDHIKM
jgi:hypothetical protein